MLNIKCKFCGSRNESEFRYGGPVKPKRPDPTQVTDEEWVKYLTCGPNPLGLVQERWWHARGCGSWVTIWRDTRTHEIVEVQNDAT